MYEIVGNLHVHTPYSDGAWYHSQIAQAAAMAGLDLVIVTDHNVWVDGVEGYYDDVLLLVGEELHDVRQLPQCNHMLVYGAEKEMAPHPGEAQQLVDAVNEKEGLSFLAHPVERSSFLNSDWAAIPWVEWELDDYTGIELWNYMSEFKSLMHSKAAAVFYALYPKLGIKGPFRHTLKLWDRLLAEGRRVVAIGGADAHGNQHSLGPWRRVVFSYEHLFRCVNTHILIPNTMIRDVVADKALIYRSLGAGHCFIGYDALGATRGFRFSARSGSRQVIMGDELKREAALIFHVEVPAPADTRLLCNGQVVARTGERRLDFTTANPGIYRVEVYRRYGFDQRAWIFSNPIYVY